jgi:hypothetical protein
MRIKKILFGLSLVFVAVGISACSTTANSDEAKKVNDQQSVYVNNQPAPTFDWSLERHIMVELYKARNNAVQTYSYIRNWQGQVVFSCKSIGFPLPANDQLTNQEALALGYGDSYSQHNATALPQAEPNGLYTSPSTSGTYVFCVNSDGTVSPSYFEANVETHLSPLSKDDSSLAGDGSLKITTTK